MPGSTTSLPDSSDLPFFDYEQHERKHEVLSAKQVELFEEIFEGRIDALQTLCDTRDVHRRLFSELCPDGYAHYAGHYRGENWPGLRNCNVEIGSDPRVGCPAPQVSGEMAALALGVRQAIEAVDELHTVSSRLTPVDKAKYAVALGCRFFVTFLTIHPFINGNGHIARFCLITILARYGLKLRRWSIEPRPSGPYGDLISLYRDGKREHLERFVFEQCDRV